MVQTFYFSPEISYLKEHNEQCSTFDFVGHYRRGLLTISVKSCTMLHITDELWPVSATRIIQTTTYKLNNR